MINSVFINYNRIYTIYDLKNLRQVFFFRPITIIYTVDQISYGMPNILVIMLIFIREKKNTKKLELTISKLVYCFFILKW